MKKSAEKNIARVLGLLPPCISTEIINIGRSRADYPDGISEVRIRRIGCSSIVLSGENIRLAARVADGDWQELERRVFGGALYAHRDTVADGYISMEGGIRIGVCADARYDEGRFVWARGINSLVFRIPSAPSECADKLYECFMRDRLGMLICSVPGGGKTSALRSLAYKLGTEGNLRTVVVDERREFIPEMYSGASVDILRGYKKYKGIEIAVRCLSAEVILVDEIGSAEEADAIAAVGDGGVPVIATAHAPSYSVLAEKRGIDRLIKGGYFGSFARLYKDAGHRFALEINERGIAN